MAAPMKICYATVSNKNLKLFKCVLQNIRFQQNIRHPRIRFQSHKAFSGCRTSCKPRSSSIFTTPVLMGFTGVTAGLYFFWFSNDFSKTRTFQTVLASTDDNLNKGRYNFIADAVDIASPAVVFLRVKR